MKFRVIERGNPLKPADPKKQFASPVNAGKFTLKDFAKELAGKSSLSRGDIEGVLTDFVDVLPTFLKLGLSIKLGDLGTMRLNLQSDGVPADEKFDGSKIKGVKVIFTPGTDLKESLKSITFEEVK